MSLNGSACVTAKLPPPAVDPIWSALAVVSRLRQGHAKSGDVAPESNAKSHLQESTQ